MTLKTHSQSWLSASWQRCQRAGLNPAAIPDELRLNTAALDERRQRHGQLLQAVEHSALSLFNQLMGRTQSRLILSDPQGFVLHHWGVSRYSQKLANIALDTGVNWLEQYKGTNAIAAALSERQCVSVIGEQHFIKSHRFMSCTASPLFSPDGELLGALDITSEQQIHTPKTAILVSSLAQQLELALLCRLPGAAVRLDLAPQQALLHSGWQGVLVLDLDGRVLGANPMARQLLKGINLGQIHQALSPLVLSRGSGRLQQGLVFRTQALEQPQHTKPVVRTSQSRESQSRESSAAFKEPRLEQAWQQARKVLARNIPLLILGETGVGKEQFVKQLHVQSARHQQPFVAVNCAAIPGELVESELFGYQAGAFTGASRQGYVGKIRQAHQGSLFLDEIGEMSLAAQSRLLRVLQEREVVPIGSNQAHSVDIQVIAATHMDLPALVQQGAFRADLYYRLNGLQVTLPALRQRSDLRRLIHKLHQRYRVRPQSLCPVLEQRLLQYHWPGNLRELDNLMQVACLMAEESPELNWQTLPESLQQTLGTAEEAMAGVAPAPGNNLHSQMQMQIRDTWLACNGNVSEAARRLGISRNTLYRKLKALALK
ncbi:sigma-54-dependent Fis family transcriptional regulator [Shewanella algae]|uniref:sigma-54-dependent Fis family transcriptional regulator n=1 Tax=Shewanella algae TaxID=38313 RepID=UPI000E3359BC|nr:sigma-54-dependent Fis family transcriptional regulator [Shewanella algae]AXQ14363.1 sigma-54-dependent Fis family transcriptional regulator [Shewanella algae]QXP20830.1 sigma-54-dependent Fis family transcriptional regulator [Shewanella algae]QXP30505.1 sigma-54-dependent Fis family transcriptional regulator [Shewanella algae]QXP32512.1 sigma-54-dependent Fis family transcriptional regulator [Shewanella algae]QXP39651.1 sigma-54-dependent Fis family transcriptional regulator [Shewanella al